MTDSQLIRANSGVPTIYGGKRLRSKCHKCKAPTNWQKEPLESQNSFAMVNRCACGNVMSSWVIDDPEFAQRCRDLATAMGKDES